LVLALVAIQSSVVAATKARAMLIPRMLMNFLVMKLPPFCG
jgi:hypothetical protein